MAPTTPPVVAWEVHLRPGVLTGRTLHRETHRYTVAAPTGDRRAATARAREMHAAQALGTPTVVSAAEVNAPDYRPGDIVAHPDHRTWGPACTAILVARDVPSGAGQVTPGVHDWFVLDCPDEPAVERTVASFPAVRGSRLIRHDPAALLGARAALAQAVA